MTGALGGGHYTATCFNEASEKWFTFNDSKVSPADESELQSPVAYVLFYKQRRSGDAGGENQTKDHWLSNPS